MPSEAGIIGATTAPITCATLVDDLQSLGLGRGMVVMVHSSLSALGWVVGGAPTVLMALREVLGAEGTVVVPAHSADNSEPSRWSRPPVPESWWPVIRATMPAFDPTLTPVRQMGAVAEAVHRAEGSRRSAHPRLSVAALGPAADPITGVHPLGEGMGERSPLARLLEFDARVLLLGVGYGNATALHLSEVRAIWPGKETVTEGSAVWLDGRRRWVTYEETAYDDSDFDVIGAAFEARGAVAVGEVGQAEGRLMPMRELVEFGAAWMSARRGQPNSSE